MPQLGRGMQGPVGIAQKGAREEDQIGWPVRRTCSAWAAEVITPTAAVGSSASARMRAALAV